MNAIVGSLLIPLLAGIVSTATTLWLYSLPLRRLPDGTHWSVVARHFWHIRNARALTMIWIVTVACVSHENELTDQGGWMIALVALSSIAGCMIGSREAGRGLTLPQTVRQATAGSTLTAMLLFPGGPSTLLIMALTWRRGWGAETLAITGIILLINLMLVMGGSVAILRRLGFLRPADDALQTAARDLASAQGLPLRFVMRMDLPMANAFAFPWTKDLGFTSATLNTLDEEELHTVISHELGHLRESLLTRWTRLTGLLAIAAIGLTPAAAHSGRPGVVLSLFLAYVLVSRLASRIHKRLEVSADQHARHSEKEDGVYARALEKIHSISLIPAVLHPRSPYPSLYDRMTDAGVVPDFPRPAPPDRVVPLLCGVVATGLFFFFSQTLCDAASTLWPPSPSHGSQP